MHNLKHHSHVASGDRKEPKDKLLCPKRGLQHKWDELAPENAPLPLSPLTIERA